MAALIKLACTGTYSPFPKLNIIFSPLASGEMIFAAVPSFLYLGFVIDALLLA
jgi:hypothetical protein